MPFSNSFDFPKNKLCGEEWKWLTSSLHNFLQFPASFPCPLEYNGLLRVFLLDIMFRKV